MLPRPKERMQWRLGFVCDDSLKKELEDLAGKHGVSVSFLLRFAAHEMLAREYAGQNEAQPAA